MGAQSDAPEMLVTNLGVRTTIADLITPISMAFIGANDFLLLEKNTGQVKRVVGGAVQGTVLDLGVNFASERGLLGIATHPNFPSNPGVYLFWTCRSTALPADPFFPDEVSVSTQTCSRRYGRNTSGAVTRKSRRSIYLEWLGSDFRSQPDHVARVPERRRARAAEPG